MTVIIEDQFGGMSLGDDIGGRTPSPTNTPGNTWTEKSANSLESDGAGLITANAANDAALIDTNIIDDILFASVDFNASGADNRMTVGILSDGVFGGTNPDDYLFMSVRDAQTVLIERIGSSSNTLATATTSRNQSTTYTYKINYDGTDLKCFRDAIEITALTQTSYSIPAGLTGQQFAGFTHALWNTPGGTFDNFIVDDLAAPAAGNPWYAYAQQ